MRTIREKVANSYFEALYAIIGYTDVVQRIIEEYPSARELSKAAENELSRIEGLGPARAKRIIGAIALSNHVVFNKDKAIIHSPEDAADLVQYEMSMLDQEQLRVMLLNTRNHVLNVVTIYQGSLNSSQVRIGEILRPAIKENAAAIIVIHNHPSGDPSPSPDDVSLTKSIIEAGKLMDIQVLDHLIIGANKFVSLNRKGLGFSSD